MKPADQEICQIFSVDFSVVSANFLQLLFVFCVWRTDMERDPTQEPSQQITMKIPGKVRQLTLFKDSWSHLSAVGQVRVVDLYNEVMSSVFLAYHCIGYHSQIQLTKKFGVSTLHL